ncbi:DUF1405 domain-containing protein [Paenibacillus sp. PAMC21692]|uniref:DUF1405 domain-containing protein n=1 Tax=Paenibacillus sp. PAMC21692 TaxID=2762320 RepID=UPI00164D8E8F|nr:DUF1405 domain-containing protein [Paenibacillus sp. PAMC21692]QNK55341.1 DUF1405 domain-containing protein [Paenibacillus sp. PAMC21692]
MGISFFWSKGFLLNRSFLWLLFICNLLGTIYGYIWYDSQLQWTAANKPLWTLPFVPDSPTASLFFTMSLLYLLFPITKPTRIANMARVLVEALAVVTSVKYGIWAVSMIVAGAAQGDVLNWTHYMLIVSHLAMAVEALLYVRFMKAGTAAFAVALGWLLINDTVDYTLNVNPWLPDELEDDRAAVELFTYGLSLASFAAAWLAGRFRKS